MSQPELFARYRAPVLTLNAACGVTGLPEHALLDAVDCGQVIAWNIATQDAGRRELRILAGSAEAFHRAECAAGYECEMDPAAAIAAVLRGSGDRPWITGTLFARLLRCSSNHVLNLVAEGSLKLLPGTKVERGWNGAPRLTRESVHEFLRTRMEGMA